jgi:hypothetical protein
MIDKWRRFGGTCCLDLRPLKIGKYILYFVKKFIEQVTNCPGLKEMGSQQLYPQVPSCWTIDCPVPPTKWTLLGNSLLPVSAPYTNWTSSSGIENTMTRVRTTDFFKTLKKEDTYLNPKHHNRQYAVNIVECPFVFVCFLVHCSWCFGTHCVLNSCQFSREVVWHEALNTVYSYEERTLRKYVTRILHCTRNLQSK